jgi:hypothetical protein
MGTDRNHLDVKIEACTGTIEVEQGSSEEVFIAAMQRRDSDTIKDFGLHSLYNDQEFWLWGNIYNTRRASIVRSVVARRCFIGDAPYEMVVDDVSINAYTYEAERIWKLRNGIGVAWDEWTASASQTSFGLTQAAIQLQADGTDRYFVVFDNGVEVWPDEDPFTVSAANLTFTTGRTNGHVIQILYPYQASTSGSEVPGSMS